MGAHEQAELGGERGGQAAPRPQGAVAPHPLQRAARPAAHLAQAVLVDLGAEDVAEGRGEVAELVGHIGHVLLGGALGDVHHEVRGAGGLGHGAEAHLVGVAGQRGVGHECRRAQDARVLHAEHELVVAAEALGDAGGLGTLAEALGAAGAGHVDRDDLGDHRRHPGRVEQLAGQEDVDDTRRLGMPEGAHHPGGDDPVAAVLRRDDPAAAGEAPLEGHGRVGEAEQPPRPGRVVHRGPVHPRSEQRDRVHGAPFRENGPGPW